MWDLKWPCSDTWNHIFWNEKMIEIFFYYYFEIELTCDLNSPKATSVPPMIRICWISIPMADVPTWTNTTKFNFILIRAKMNKWNAFTRKMSCLKLFVYRKWWKAHGKFAAASLKQWREQKKTIKISTWNEWITHLDWSQCKWQANK